MPPKNKNRRAIRELRDQFDLGPGYAGIIRDAVINDWSEQELTQAIVHSPVFRRQYPGLIDADGYIQDFLAGANRAQLTPSTLAAATQAYNQLWKSYEDVASNYKSVFGPVTRDKVAALIRGDVSPDELQTKLFSVQKATSNPEALDIFNEQLEAAGLKPLAGKDAYKFYAKTASQKVYDVYEAARVRQLAPGAGFSADDAKKIAESLQNVDEQGRPTGPANVGQLLEGLTANLSDIGPELRQAGIDNLAIARYLANPGEAPELATKIQQLIATKRGRGQYVAGSQPKQGPGGVKLYDDNRTAAYG